MTPPKIRRLRDVAEDEKPPLELFLSRIRAAPDGVETDRIAGLASEVGVAPELLERAVLLYVPREGRVRLTGLGANFLTAAQNLERIKISVLPHGVDRAIQRRLIAATQRSEARQEVEREVRALKCSRRRQPAPESPHA